MVDVAQASFTEQQPDLSIIFSNFKSKKANFKIICCVN